MPIPVVADADTLFGGTTRGLLIHLDYERVIHLHWSEMLLDEMSRALVKTGRKPDMVAAKRHEAIMQSSLSGAKLNTRLVQQQYKTVAPAVNSAKDTHVAACAYALVATKAYPTAPAVSLVTRNLLDFDAPALAALNVLVSHPDPFLVQLWRAQPLAVARAFRSLRLSLARSQATAPRLLDRLAADGQRGIAAAMLAAHRAGAAAL